MYYVYMLESVVDGDFYKGCTDNYERRLQEHNNGESKFTRSKSPWILIYVEAFETKREALIRERQLKNVTRSIYVG